MRELLKFSTPTCQPCKQLGAVLDEVLPEFSDVTLTEVNIEHDPDTARLYGVQSVPTLVLLDELGAPYRVAKGAQRVGQVRDFLQP